ncbi:MAG TPA: YibE/F family protein [Actinomycetota bacterium]|nr:YibE/F family protein [Actinomycetota bacterium]
MGSGHAHGTDLDVPARTTRLLTIAAVAGAVVTLVGIAVLRVSPDDTTLGVPGTLAERIDAEVRSVDLADCPGQQDAPEGTGERCLEIVASPLEGPDRGRPQTIVLPDLPTSPDLDVGETIVLGYEPSAEQGFRYSFLDRQRKPVLAWLVVLFAIPVVVLGRSRGAAALVGLALSVVVLLTFILPSIIAGRPPVLVAIFGAAAIAYLALYLAHGFNPMTTVALLGALTSLGLTAALAHLFVVLTRLSGFASEEAILIQLSIGQLDASGLVLAGIVIGALGALDDVTVTQASAVWEISGANPTLSAGELYRSGLRVGRDHVASVVNTLLLAYAGAAMPLLVFFVVSQAGLADVANEEVVATEIVRTMVGSIGLVAAVPITTWLAARVAVIGRPRD